MSRTTNSTTTVNPLAQIATTIPDGVASVVSIAARAIG